MPDLRSSRVVVTGAGGVIGSGLVRGLAALGATVTAIDRHHPDPAPTGENVRCVTADVTDAERMRDLLAGADIVYHLAYLMGEEANRDPVAAARINVLGGTTVLQACLDGGVGRVLLASSISVFGSTADYREDELPLSDRSPRLGSKGISVYGAGKAYLELLAEHYTRRHGLLVGGLRPGAVIGRSRTTGRARTVANIVSTAVHTRRLSFGNGREAFTAIHVDDVVGAFLALGEAPAPAFRETAFFNLAGDHATVRSLCEEVAALVPGVTLDIADGDSDELFGTTPFIRDDGIHRTVGFTRRYPSLRAAVAAEVAELTEAAATA